MGIFKSQHIHHLPTQISPPTFYILTILPFLCLSNYSLFTYLIIFLSLCLSSTTPLNSFRKNVNEGLIGEKCEKYVQFLSSVQFSRSVVSDSLRPHELQHARPPCLSTTRVHPNSCPSSRWYHPAISSSVVSFSSCPQSLPTSESFSMSQRFASDGQSTGVSALASLFPKKSQDWSPSEWTGWISLQSKGLSRVFSNATVQKHQFFGAQPLSQSNSHIHTWPQEKPQPWPDGP